MNDERWIVIPNWAKFQHYQDRNPVWMKLYFELNSRDDWRQLSFAQRGMLVSIWVEYGRSGGQLRASDLAYRVGKRDTKGTLESLTEAGFIVLTSSKPLALTRSREAYRSKEETPKPPSAKKARKAKTTGWRIVRGSHGMTTIPDPNGTDPAPTIGRPL